MKLINNILRTFQTSSPINGFLVDDGRKHNEKKKDSSFGLMLTCPCYVIIWENKRYNSYQDILVSLNLYPLFLFKKLLLVHFGKPNYLTRLYIIFILLFSFRFNSNQRLTCNSVWKECCVVIGVSFFTQENPLKYISDIIFVILDNKDLSWVKPSEIKFQ